MSRDGVEAEQKFGLAHGQAGLRASGSEGAGLSGAVSVSCGGGTYTGEMVDGAFHGTGTFVSSAFTYTGGWVADAMHGHGDLVLADGSSYVGSFAHNMYHGSGKLVLADGESYDGDWVHHVRCGRGTLVLPNGAGWYAGCWLDGSMHGRGEALLADGSRYTGDWYAGVMHGSGTIVAADGTAYVGSFDNGVRAGSGTLTATGRVYSGEWAAGAPHGTGTLIFDDGRSYDGEWDAGRPHGKGVFRFADGASYSGHWEHGVLLDDGAVFVSASGEQDVMDLEEASRGLPAPYTWYDPVVHSLSCKLMDRRAALAATLREYDVSRTRHGFLPLARVRQALRNIGIRLDADEYDFVLAMFGPNSQWINTDDLVRFVTTAEREWHRRHPHHGPSLHQPRRLSRAARQARADAAAFTELDDDDCASDDSDCLADVDAESGLMFVEL
ncbi:morn domain-containing protein-containing protein [Thecamonas trahens ATCC 50062]|uniref:Morn domain-containing protein-containing protein n=1 Tax=Thecamonas trahens ATCC 50062 TaxID=461836 RepID=A0A0L0DNH4_THETB|nr:morn domain-containing protein-containing protein [Thecamonas trahens ATCC 50062]KNC52968.1 morn domain-containing protein-containing protein [Thecamonas trahens ATCC 50062]|eukprot:XP_013754860.1 morn domain-containing protein-containing protein [Thecamonas trahens ATCC 50062]